MFFLSNLTIFTVSECFVENEGEGQGYLNASMDWKSALSAILISPPLIDWPNSSTLDRISQARLLLSTSMKLIFHLLN
jgi:hypothetical protein